MVRSSCSERTGSQTKGVEKITQGSHSSSVFQPITASCKIMPQGQVPSPAESPGKSFQPITMSCKIVSGEAPCLCVIQCLIHILTLKTEPLSVHVYNDLLGTLLHIRAQFPVRAFPVSNNCCFYSFLAFKPYMLDN